MEQVRDPLLDAPKLERQLQKALAAHHAALTAQLEGTLAQWQLLQQYTVAEMAWRELDMQVRGPANSVAYGVCCAQSSGCSCVNILCNCSCTAPSMQLP